MSTKWILKIETRTIILTILSIEKKKKKKIESKNILFDEKN